MEKEFFLGRELKKGIDLVRKVWKEKQNKVCYEDVKKARLYLIEEIEQIILENDGKRLYNDINFDLMEGCGTEGPSLDNRLYSIGKDGIIFTQFIAGLVVNGEEISNDFIRVALGRYDKNKKAYANLEKKLKRVEGIEY
jgi:hypothetical protein